jgi:gliding motility-associated-like protein
VYYSFGDGGSSTDPNLLYEYSAGGLFWITQTVVNAYGCTDVAQGQVAVNGSLFYAPNTFTPNNDGINDVWLPVVTGSTSYRLEIFDRWGVKIFETFNAEVPWLGNVLNGEHFAPDGMYSFRVWMEDQIKMPSEYAGTILLFR